MKRSEVLALGCQLASGILSNPISGGSIMNRYEVEQRVRECAQLINELAVEMNIPVIEDVAEK